MKRIKIIGVVVVSMFVSGILSTAFAEEQSGKVVKIQVTGKSGDNSISEFWLSTDKLTYQIDLNGKDGLGASMVNAILTAYQMKKEVTISYKPDVGSLCRVGRVLIKD